MRSRELLELAHHHPGRLRVRSDGFCCRERDDELGGKLDLVRSRLATLAGVRSIHVNCTSGSILVEYEPGAIDPNRLIDAIALTADLEVPDEEVRARRVYPAHIAIDAARSANSLARELTGGRADLRVLLPIALGGLAAYSFIEGKDRMPRWDNLAYWALSLFQTWHGDEIADGKDARP
ncbi:MAG TPA: hypothetical protein VM580_27740 [Labilithrix sp.]|nr:hypothetical protein [Labilithrix sp.]